MSSSVSTLEKALLGDGVGDVYTNFSDWGLFKYFWFSRSGGVEFVKSEVICIIRLFYSWLLYSDVDIGTFIDLVGLMFESLRILNSRVFLVLYGEWICDAVLVINEADVVHQQCVVGMASACENSLRIPPRLMNLFPSLILAAQKLIYFLSHSFTARHI